MKPTCFHCGDQLGFRPIIHQEKSFCCNGCKSVFQLLSSNDLVDFYKYEKTPGIKPVKTNNDKYAFLDISEIKKRYVKFEDDQLIKVVLKLPNIHCSSCIYLLENAHKIEKNIITSQVHFAKKEASITFKKEHLPLSELALLLDNLGYPPNFQAQNSSAKSNHNFLLRIGIAGFAFGSIMLWSFPEYTGIGKQNLDIRAFTSWLSFAVSVPVLLISAREYYVSAYKALRSHHLNLDVPITLGIIALYSQSVYSIINQEGPGYMDSFSGFIFFLLIGKWFQNTTYQSLTFDRDYTSYFPVAVRVVVDKKEEILPIEKIEIGDIIRIRNQEIIPCDTVLLNTESIIDYSFVTGESSLIYKYKGEELYAGGKIMGNVAEMEVKRKSDRSHLTQLWNESLHNKNKTQKIRYQDKISALFLYTVLIISAIAAIVWATIDPQMILKVVVSVLIVACPCALALSTPFTYGNAMRKMGSLGCYLKNIDVVESMDGITAIVFDKTGTLTDPQQMEIIPSGDIVTIEDQSILFEMTGSSTHPLSAALHSFLANEKLVFVEFDSFNEHIGKGIEVSVVNDSYLLGNAAFTQQGNHNNNELFFTKNGITIQKYVFKSQFRSDIKALLSRLNKTKNFVLSGDSDSDLPSLLEIGFKKENIYFLQSPNLKHDFIQNLQSNGEKVMMLGDGLNDASALAQADIGIAISEDMFKFTPSSEAILDAKKLNKLDDFIAISKFSRLVLKICLGFSILYNLTGIIIAVSGMLSPLIAAILMPLSSITIVLLSTSLIFIRFRSLKN